MTRTKTIPLILSIYMLMGFIPSGEELRAQDFLFKGEVFGKIGAAWPNDVMDGLGRGFVFGGGAGCMISDRWEIVAEVQSQRNDLELGPGRFFYEGELLTIGGNFQYHFSKSRLQPYLRLGLNYARFEGARGFRADDNNPETVTAGKQAFWRPDVGFGCIIFVSKHVSIKPEARLYLGGLPDYDPSWDPVNPGLFRTEFGIGIGYHW